MSNVPPPAPKTPPPTGKDPTPIRGPEHWTFSPTCPYCNYEGERTSIPKLDGRLSDETIEVECYKCGEVYQATAHIRWTTEALNHRFRWFFMEEETYTHEERELERKWKKQQGIDPETGKAWLTPRMARNALRAETTMKLEEMGMRKALEEKDKR